MNEIIGMHGIGQQQGGRNQLLSRWRRALADGMEQAVGHSRPRWVIKWLLKGVNRVRPNTALRVPDVLIQRPPLDRGLQCKDALEDADDAGQ